MKKIYYVGEDIAIFGTAMSLHAENVAMLFKRCGYSVTFICDSTNKSQNSFLYNNFYYHCGYSISNKYNHKFEELFGNKLFNTFLDVVSIDGIPDFVVFYGYSAEKKLIKYCQKHKIPFILERVDWFSKEDRNGFYGKYIYQKKVDYAINNIDHKANGVIVISKFLYNCYQNKNDNILLLPPVFEKLPVLKNNSVDRKNDNEFINLVYAGSLNGSKDIIVPAIDAVLKVNKDHQRFIFNIIGEVPVSLSEKYSKEHNIVFYGKLNHEDTTKIISRSDFGFLLRHNRRYAKAGFSTKFAEMMSYGVPMICTKVGGADDLIDSGINGFLLEDNSVQTIESVLRYISTMSTVKKSEMKRKARLTAENNFLIEKHMSDLNNFIRNIEDEINF